MKSSKLVSLPLFICISPNHFAKKNSGLQSQRGFTLIELIVVVLIIGLLLTMASMSVTTSSDKSLETEAKRFAALIKLASDESIMNSQPMAVQIAKQIYQFNFGGETETVDKIFRPREIADHIHINVVIEDEKINFDALDEGTFANIYVFPSGEMTPFTITFYQDNGAAYEITGDYYSNIEYVGQVERVGF